MTPEQAAREILIAIESYPLGVATSDLRESFGGSTLLFGDAYAILKGEGLVESFSDYCIAKKNYRNLVDRIEENLHAAHQEHPADALIDLFDLLVAMEINFSRKGAERLARKLAHDPTFRVLEGGVGLVSFRPQRPLRQADAAARLVSFVHDSPVPVTIRELEAGLHLSNQAVMAQLRFAVEDGDIHELTAGDVIAPHVLESLLAKISDSFPDKAFSIGDVRRAGIVPRRWAADVLLVMAQKGYLDLCEEGYRLNPDRKIAKIL